MTTRESCARCVGLGHCKITGKAWRATSTCDMYIRKTGCFSINHTLLEKWTRNHNECIWQAVCSLEDDDDFHFSVASLEGRMRQIARYRR